MEIKDKIADMNIAKSMDQSINISGSISKTSKNSSGSKVVDGLHDALSGGSTVGNIKIKDGYFTNPIEKTGTASISSMAGFYDLSMITFNRGMLTALYHSCWELRKGIDKVAEDMWARGIEIRDVEDPTKLKALYTWMARQNSEMIYATQQGRLYGGAVTLMMVDDGEKDLSKPLQVDKIKKGSLINFYSTDRWYGVTQSTEKVTDFQDIAYGEPEFYSFTIDGENEQKVHHTRVLRWVNKRSPRYIESRLLGWGISELEAALQDLMNYSNVKNSSASLVNKALVEIIKLQGLRGVMTGLAGGNTSANSVLAGQMSAINDFRNSNGVALLDSMDDYQQNTMSFSGLSELIDVNRPIVAGAFNMPLFYLFGDTKTGGVFNSEESPEARMYESFILNRQNEMLYKNIRKLLIIGSKITGVALDKDFDFDFIPLYDRTEEAKREELKNITENAIQLMDAGLLTHETALLEVQSANKRTGFGLHIEDRDFKLAQDADKAAKENPEEEGTDESVVEETRETVSNPKRINYDSLFVPKAKGGK